MMDVILAIVVTALAMGVWVVRLRTLMDHYLGASQSAHRAAAEARRERDEALQEVKRLTDVIIQMKERGAVAPPWAGTEDERFGTYVIDDDLELEEERRREREADAARAQLDDDALRKDLEDF